MNVLYLLIRFAEEERLKSREGDDEQGEQAKLERERIKEGSLVLDISTICARRESELTERMEKECMNRKKSSSSPSFLSSFLV